MVACAAEPPAQVVSTTASVEVVPSVPGGSDDGSAQTMAALDQAAAVDLWNATVAWNAGVAANERAAAEAAEQEAARRSQRPHSTYSGGGVWAAVAQCESGGDWSANTGNGYFGGLQENMAFWSNYGGLAYASRPDLASASQQIAVAERGLAVQGWGAWPGCSRLLGLR